LPRNVRHQPWVVPYAEMDRRLIARRSEIAACMHVNAGDANRIDAAIRAAAHRIPPAARDIPARYVAGARPACRAEPAARVLVAAAYRQRIHRVVRAAHAAAQGGPLVGGAIPARYIVGGCAACCVEAAAYVNISARYRYRRHAAI